MRRCQEDGDIGFPVMLRMLEYRAYILVFSGKTSSARLPHASAPVTPGSLDGTDPTLCNRDTLPFRDRSGVQTDRTARATEEYWSTC